MQYILQMVLSYFDWLNFLWIISKYTTILLAESVPFIILRTAAEHIHMQLVISLIQICTRVRTDCPGNGGGT